MKSKGWYWPWLIAALLIATVAGQGVMLWAASHDDTMAIEPDYYRKAVAWDSTAALDSASRALRWQATVGIALAGKGDSELSVVLTDSTGMPVDSARVHAVMIHNLDGARHIEATLVSAGAGRYVATLPLDHTGMWEVRLVAERGRDRFAISARAEAVAQAAAKAVIK